jgi:CubicO group peptidase (beta-lactamase class C family)
MVTEQYARIKKAEKIIHTMQIGAKEALALLLITFHILVAQTSAATFGPGKGAWSVAPPEVFGLNSSHYATASSNVEKIRERYCLLVVKKGIIISETYYANDSQTTYETDSAAKTMIALLIGAVWTHRSWDLDLPLSKFGVNTSIFNEWRDVVTTRHVLTQASGKGIIPPGTGMTYDSNQYIQTLSPLLGKVLEKDNITVLDWAEEHFASVLGIGGVFRNNDLYIGGGNVSIGGGQRMTCRQIARCGQLMLNKGNWIDKDNNEFVLVDPVFIAESKKPSFPNAFTTYGFLTWLNFRGSAPSFCCAPRWCVDAPRGGGNLWGGFSGTSLHGIIGDDISYGYGPDAQTIRGPVISASEDAMVALGYLGRLMMMFPSNDTVVVTMGQTGSQTLLGGGCDYDEGYALSLIYQAIEPLLHIKSNMTLANTAMKDWQRQQQQNTSKSVRVELEHSTREKGTGDTSSVTSNQKPVIGSCFCFCPPGEGYGKCFDVYEEDDIVIAELSSESGDAVVDPCSKFQQSESASAYCPSIGVAQQCSTAVTGALLPSPSCADESDDWKGTECTVMAACPDRQGRPAEPFDTEFCKCTPTTFQYCYFIPSSTNCGDGSLEVGRSTFQNVKKNRFKF